MDMSIFQVNQKNKILIVDDEPMNVAHLVHILGSEYTLFVEKNGQSALETAAKQTPDLILLDIHMPGLSGYDVIKTLKAQHETSGIPVIFITGLDDNESEIKGLEFGAADYITKPFSPAIVNARVKIQMQVIDYVRTIHRLSLTDALTEMPNRRYFNERLQLEWYRAVREGTPLGFLLLDIDNFKRINDNYGHIQGDVVLKAIAYAMTEELKRFTDLVARWGGEEFAVILPDTDILGAQKVANNLLSAISAAEVLLEDNTPISVTASIGVNSIIPTLDCSLNSFVSDTDKALYCAKRAGKNCISPAL